MANVLIIGINYRPETTGTAPYTSAFAEHLAAGGHQVTVLTGFAHYPAWRHEPGERRLRATEQLDGVRILRRRHYVPGSQSALRRAIYEGTFLLNGALSRPGRSDVVFGIIPSLSGGILARLFSARARAPYGLIVQDLMAPAARQSGIRGGGRVTRVTAALERWAAAKASTVGIASESFRPYLNGLGVPDERIVLFPNWVHVGAPSADRVSTRERLGWPAEATVVLHAGNMGLKQGLEQVVAAAQRAGDDADPLLYVLMGDGSQRAGLEAMAAGVKHLEFLPFQPEAELPNILAAADVLLVSERDTVIDMSLPSKLTTYFAAGRPVVAAVPEAGATATEVRRSGAGVVVPVAHPDELNRAVAHLRANPAFADTLGLAGRAYAASSLDRSHALSRIDELLDRTLGATATGRG
ncbi:MAG TPA: glycosyltransferase family 4 protein [Candidatus Limnocylindrales bacterium]|jgi:glycosyltransferase involved in cell wall biosynthesis|nr:glycosyltransferase family 4 protein [Candidatus Limnocylindrales bacterium]